VSVSKVLLVWVSVIT